MTGRSGFEPGTNPAERRALFDLQRLIKELSARVDSLAVIPSGTIVAGPWSVAPAGFLLLNGALIAGGVATYPALAAAYPAWVSGADLQLPNADGRVLMGATSSIGGTGGSNSVTLVANNIPTHTHAVGTLATANEGAHTHGVGTFATASDGAHTHGGVVVQNAGQVTLGTGFQVGTGSTGSAGAHTHSITGSSAAGTNHSHTITGATGNNTTTGAAVDVTNAHIKVRMAVKT